MRLAIVLLLAGSGFAGPTFYKDVLPILEQHCQTCHRAGEPVPMSLTDYSEARKWAGAAFYMQGTIEDVWKLPRS